MYIRKEGIRQTSKPLYNPERYLLSDYVNGSHSPKDTAGRCSLRVAHNYVLGLRYSCTTLLSTTLSGLSFLSSTFRFCLLYSPQSLLPGLAIL
jgi:hypothetical protein